MRAVAGALFLGMTATAAPAETGNDPTEVEAAVKGWIEAFDRADAAALAGLYDPDATVVPPNGVRLDGRGMEAYWRGVVGKDARFQDMSHRRLRVDSDLAYETAHFTVKMQGNGDAGGSILTVFCKGAAGWRICAQMWTMDP